MNGRITQNSTVVAVEHSTFSEIDLNPSEEQILRLNVPWNLRLIHDNNKF